MKELREKLECTENKLAFQTPEFEKLNTEHQQLKKQYEMDKGNTRGAEEAKVKERELKEKIEKLESSMSDKERELRDAKKETDKLKDALKELQEEFSSEQGKREAFESKTQQLNEKLEKCKEELKSMDKKLEDFDYYKKRSKEFEGKN